MEMRGAAKGRGPPHAHSNAVAPVRAFTYLQNGAAFQSLSIFAVLYPPRITGGPFSSETSKPPHHRSFLNPPNMFNILTCEPPSQRKWRRHTHTHTEGNDCVSREASLLTMRPQRLPFVALSLRQPSRTSQPGQTCRRMFRFLFGG